MNSFKRAEVVQQGSRRPSGRRARSVFAFSLAAGLLGTLSTFAGDAPASPAPQPALPSVQEIFHLQAQEFARASVQLKLQEAALRAVSPLDNEKLKVILAQEKAVNEGLLRLLVAPLELELKLASDQGLAPGHPRYKEIQRRIEETKALFSAAN